MARESDSGKCRPLIFSADRLIDGEAPEKTLEKIVRGSIRGRNDKDAGTTVKRLLRRASVRKIASAGRLQAG